MSSTDSKISKIQTNFKALSEVASSLNTASDELTKVVSKLDEALKKLNVGLTAWVIFADRLPSEDMQYDCDQIGYYKVDGKWGISLRKIWGHEGYDDHNVEGPWLFNDAPREMRLRSVDKLPELIESLNEKASETTTEIQEKTKEVGELAAAIEEAAQVKPPSLDQVRKAQAIATAQKAKLTGKLSEMLGDTKEGGK